MIPLTDKWSINLDITTKCGRGCLYCSRYSRHLRPDMIFDMPLDQFAQALDSYKGFPKRIGLSGGEPVIHAQFPEICKLVRDRFPREQMILYASNPQKLQEHSYDVDRTFGLVCFNEHSPIQLEMNLHQASTVAIEEAVPDEVIREQLIDGCWVQRTWCATITTKGAYFCELAANIDLLLYDGESAWPVEKDWWKRTDYSSQRHLCQKCGMAIPMERDRIKQKFERMTPKLYEEMKAKGLRRLEDVQIFDKKLTRQDIEEWIPKWYPGNYRTDLTDDAHCMEGLGFLGKLR